MSVINTNITSMISQGNLNKSKNSLTTAMERLSSGMRINSAKDDAAGQAIANRMTSQVRGLAQAQRNANDGISVAQTAEGALNQINDNLQRIRELSVQAANGTNNDDDLTSIQNEIGQRLNEINRISEETSFNGVKVLASDQGLKIQVGANDSEAITVNLQEINSRTLGLTGFNVNGKGETPNAAATADSLTLAGAQRVGSSNEYVVAEANGKVTANALFSNVKDGDVIRAATVPNTKVTSTNLDDLIARADKDEVLSIGATNYKSVGDGTFSYDQKVLAGAAKAYLEDKLTPAAGKTVEATVKLVDGTGGTQEVNIKVSSDGKITGADGNALYWDNTSKNLSATNTGALTQATDSDLATYLSSGAADGSTLKIGDITYTTDSVGDVNVSGQTIDAAGLADLRNTASATFTFDVDGSEVQITGNGTGSTAAFTTPAGDVYLTADGGVSTQAAPTVTGFDSAYTYDAAKGNFTYNQASTFDGASPVGAAAQIKTLEDAMRPDVGSTTSATITLGGKSIDVTIGSDGGLTSTASGNKLFLDAANNLTETNAAGSTPAATVTNVAQALLTVDDSSLKINGGATYTVNNDGTTASTLTATGLTASAAEVADRLDDNANGSFEYEIANFDGNGNSQTVALTLNANGGVASATFKAGVISSGTAYVGADGNLTANATEDTSYWVQSNGNVTNDSGQRIYQDAQGGFTTEASTAGERTEDPLAALDAALNMVDALRSDLGAIQNRFDSAITNLRTNETNLSAARSRIEDADYAVEVANMTRAQILQQAGTSVLAQANQVPQGVLSLLR